MFGGQLELKQLTSFVCSVDQVVIPKDQIDHLLVKKHMKSSFPQMARRNNLLSSIFRNLTSWVPRRSENISREFWMPDDSCQVCYECDTDFTLLNRRHHCRQCGRIFCGSCTKNSIPSRTATLRNDTCVFESNGTTERLRACNYCFRQWQNEMKKKKMEIVYPNVSTMSSTGNDRLDENNGHANNDGRSIFNHHGENCKSNDGSTKPESLMDLSEEREIFSTAQFGFLMTRSDNESEAYSDHFQSSYDSQHGSNSYYPCSDISNTSPSRDEIKLSDGASSIFDEKQDNESDTNNSHHNYTASSKLYEIKSPRYILDLHGNLALWSPPEPENEEDQEIGEIYDEQIQFNDSSRESDNNTVSTECDSDSIVDDQEETSGNTPEDKFKLVLFQLLHNEGVHTGCEDGNMSWVDIIESLARNVAYVVKPDTSNGGSMDPIGYVKIKCLASGNRDESTVVKGIICKKNTAHRRMASRLEDPKIMILGGCLEYQRVLSSLSSIDTLLQQEREHLKMAIMRIEAQKPDILLVERTVARSAQDLLLHKNIPLVLNIKKPLLQRIAQCTGATIASSIDQLSPKLMGTCESFHIDKFIEEHEGPEKGKKRPIKNMMFLEGCPNPSSCTILLRGATLDILKKVKHIVRVAIFVAYHASLEKSFLEDERASLPESSLKAPITVPLPNIPLTTNSSICVVPGFRLGGEKHPTDRYLSQSHNSFEGSSSNIKGYAKITKLDDSTECEMLSKDKLLLEDNRNVVVSLSTRCVWKRSICGNFQVFRIKYYGNFDKPLEQYLRENLFDKDHLCRFCDLPPEAHSHCYTHQRGTVTISMKRLPDLNLTGERERKIWTWHRCLKCPQENGLPPTSKRVILSDDTMGLSFGRSLELCFSEDNAAKRVAECGHYIHTDCVRFYGTGSLVASMHYEEITINSALVPPFTLQFDNRHSHRIDKEVAEFIERAKQLFEEIFSTLHQLLDQRAQIEELEGILRKEKSEFEVSLNKVLRREEKQLDILEINKLRRQLVFFSHLWDQRLTFIAKSLKMRMPSPKNNVNRANKSQNNSRKRSESVRGKIEENTLISSISVSEETVSRERGLISRRTLSAGHCPLITNDPYDVLDTKWSGRNDPNDILDNVLSSLENSTSGDISIPRANDPSSWIMSPFLHFYQSLNKKLGIFDWYNPLHAYTPVYISSPESLSGDTGPRFLPMGVDDIVIPIFNDEPSSIISYALASPDYHNQLLKNNHNECSSRVEKKIPLPQPPGKISAESSRRTHYMVSFGDDGPLGKTGYSVICYYAKQFDMLRKLCCISEVDFLRSLSRCKKWKADGGKSKVFFAKSLDDRFIIKQVTKVELESFMKFGPTYFKYLSDSIGSGSPTCLAKVLGIYQTTSKNVRGKEQKIDLLIMENLLFDHNFTRLYDLKGSTRSRYNPDTSGNNKVLLDENLIEAMPTSPIFVWKKAKRLLERAIWNDTYFLSSIGVMDYSLLVGVDEEQNKLTVGIIDFMRQYTWDKHLESWVKASGILGGPKNLSPTVISPKEYKVRFRKAMSLYFLVIPDDFFEESHSG